MGVSSVTLPYVLVCAWGRILDFKNHSIPYASAPKNNELINSCQEMARSPLYSLMDGLAR